MEKVSVIYVRLLDEGVDCWRPVDARQTADDVFEIISENPDPGDERWEFNVGQSVRCQARQFSGGNSEPQWVAVQEA